MPDPGFSIVIPWHRDRALIRRSVASALAQSASDFEVLIVANGDALAETAWLEAEFSDPRVSVLTCPTANANAARGAGIAAARGAFIALLDADDEFLPKKLETASTLLAETGADVMISRGVREIRPGERHPYPVRTIGEDENASEYFFVAGSNCTASAIVVRRGVLACHWRSHGVPPKYEDVDILIRLQAAGHRIVMAPEPLFVWHDETEAGRLSRGGDYEAYLEWVERLGPAFTDRAKAAFEARRVAQYTFFEEPGKNLGRFWDGWRQGGIGATETMMLFGRALLPAELARRGVEWHARMSAPPESHKG